MEDRYWNDHPASEHCGTCIHFQDGSCDDPAGYRYEEHVHESYDACDEWEDGR